MIENRKAAGLDATNDEIFGILTIIGVGVTGNILCGTGELLVAKSFQQTKMSGLHMISYSIYSAVFPTTACMRLSMLQPGINDILAGNKSILESQMKALGFLRISITAYVIMLNSAFMCSRMICIAIAYRDGCRRHEENVRMGYADIKIRTCNRIDRSAKQCDSRRGFQAINFEDGFFGSEEFRRDPPKWKSAICVQLCKPAELAETLRTSSPIGSVASTSQYQRRPLLVLAASDRKISNLANHHNIKCESAHNAITTATDAAVHYQLWKTSGGWDRSCYLARQAAPALLTKALDREVEKELDQAREYWPLPVGVFTKLVDGALSILGLRNRQAGSHSRDVTTTAPSASHGFLIQSTGSSTAGANRQSRHNSYVQKRRKLSGDSGILSQQGQAVDSVCDIVRDCSMLGAAKGLAEELQRESQGRAAALVLHTWMGHGLSDFFFTADASTQAGNASVQTSSREATSNQQSLEMSFTSIPDRRERGAVASGTQLVYPLGGSVFVVDGKAVVAAALVSRLSELWGPLERRGHGGTALSPVAPQRLPLLLGGHPHTEPISDVAAPLLVEPLQTIPSAPTASVPGMSTCAKEEMNGIDAPARGTSAASDSARTGGPADAAAGLGGLAWAEQVGRAIRETGGLALEYILDGLAPLASGGQSSARVCGDAARWAYLASAAGLMNLQLWTHSVSKPAAGEAFRRVVYLDLGSDPFCRWLESNLSTISRTDGKSNVFANGSVSTPWEEDMGLRRGRTEGMGAASRVGEIASSGGPSKQLMLYLAKSIAASGVELRSISRLQQDSEEKQKKWVTRKSTAPSGFEAKAAGLELEEIEYRDEKAIIFVFRPSDAELASAVSELPHRINAAGSFRGVLSVFSTSEVLRDNIANLSSLIVLHQLIEQL